MDEQSQENQQDQRKTDTDQYPAWQFAVHGAIDPLTEPYLPAAHCNKTD